MYYRFSEGLNNYKLIPETEDVQELIKNRDKDYYVSIYKYNEDQFQHWKKTKSVAGIKDVITDRIVLDFDDKDNIENARQDTITAISRLTQKGIPQDAIQVAFSGNKGFSVEVKTDKTFSVDEFKTLTKNLAGDLSTYDTVVNDPQRIFRVVGTKHNATNYYKVPLTIDQVVEWDIKDIKQYASDLSNVDTSIMEKWDKIKLPESVYQLKEKKKETTNVVPFSEAIMPQLDMSQKPRWLTPAKFALQEGYFVEGQRSQALTILAATYKNQGINKDIAYRMLKGVAEVQARRNNAERFADKEIYNNIINVVYGPNWKGGQYSKDHPFLVQIAESLGLDARDEDPKVVIEVTDIHKEFIDYAKNFEKNIVRTGIPSLDENVMFLTSTHNGILGQPGAGKTSLAIQWLEHISAVDSSAIFYSLDMAKPIIYANLIKRVEQVGFREAMRIFKEESNRADKIAAKISEKYKNVKFSFKTGSSPDSIRDDIKRHEDSTGVKTRLLVVDYLECLQGPYSDATANTGYISNQMKDLATELGVCSVMLLQTQKHGGDISDPITSMKRIKGSSIIEQSSSVILTLWREGYDPMTISQDKFMSFAAVKNRFGPLWQDDFYFKGSSGQIWEIDENGREEIEQLRKDKAAKKASEAAENGGF